MDSSLPNHSSYMQESLAFDQHPFANLSLEREADSIIATYPGSKREMDVDRTILDVFDEAFVSTLDDSGHTEVPELPVTTLHQPSNLMPSTYSTTSSLQPIITIPSSSNWAPPISLTPYLHPGLTLNAVLDLRPPVKRESTVCVLEKRRERNRVLARKTRNKKKNESELLRDKLVALLAENNRLKSVMQSYSMKIPTLAPFIEEEFKLPENVQKFVAQVLQSNKKATYEDIPLKQRSYCVADARAPQLPIVFISSGFIKLTGFTREECLGRNCKFLQGPDTDREEVKRISQCLADQVDTDSLLLNYKKDGTSFWNQIELAHLRDSDEIVRYIVGVQNECDSQYIRVRLARFRANSTQIASTTNSSKGGLKDRAIPAATKGEETDTTKQSNSPEIEILDQVST